MYEQICVDVKMSKLDQNDKEMLTEIRNLNTETIPKVILGIHGSKIQEWEENSANIVETKAIMSLKDLIYRNSIVNITGPPGCGKSTASQCVALYLQNNHGYHIVPANYPAEILQYRNPEQKQVFVYDDVCGKYEIEIHTVNDWIKLSPDILKVLTLNGVRVLATCRSNISRNKQFERIKIFSKNQCDFHSHQNSLTTNERILIAEKFLEKEDVNILKGHKLLDKYDMFPLLCRFYSRKPTGSLTAFFSRPIDVIKEDLESLMDADDQTSYATLALFVLCNNCIKTDMLSSSSIIKQILEELADRCTLRHVFSLQVVKSQLDMLTDSYVEKSNDTYKIIHDKICDILVSFFGEHMFDLVLLHSGLDFLRNRFQFQSIDANQEDCPIIVPIDKEGDYFDFLFKDVTCTEWSMIVFDNKLLQYRTYRTKLLNYIAVLPNEKIVSLKRWFNDIYCPLLFVARDGYEDVVDVLIKLGVSVNCVDPVCRTPLLLACKNGHEDTVRLLLEHGADSNHCCYYTLSPLLVSSFKGNIEIVKMLLQYGSDTNPTNTELTYFRSKTFLFDLDYEPMQNCSICGFYDTCVNKFTQIASKETRKIMDVLYNHHPSNTVNVSDKYVFCKQSRFYDLSFTVYNERTGTLLKHFCNPDNFCQFGTSSPLYAAAATGNLQMVKLLCDYGAKTYDSDLFLYTPLHVAVFYGHIEITQYLINKNVDINGQNKEGETPLYIASKNGNEEIAKLLLQHNANVNLCNVDGISPLFIACFWSNQNVVELLIHFRADVNMCGNRDDSPLFIACLKGDVELLPLLLEKNLCINIRTQFSLTRMSARDVFGRAEFLSRFTFRDMLWLPFESYDIMEEHTIGCVTPLYIACSIGYKDVVDMLLVKGADVNFCNKNHESCLFAAAGKGHSEIVKILLERNVNPNICNEDNESPLFIASFNGHIKVVEYLLQFNADCNIANRLNETALSISVQRSRTMLNVVILNFDEKYRILCRHSCCKTWRRWTNIVKLLLESKADIFSSSLVF
ncbi:ankyrin-1-like [Mytilus trossulus]|uniref:ankyrin-1-like n=1 Tax=Mytilus trossulus TaxID=6551 RepID=UPI003003D8CE